MACNPNERNDADLYVCREIDGYLITEGADLRGADLRGADLTEMWLPGVDFRGADLEGASFDGSWLAGARFDYARAAGGSFLVRVNGLTGVDFTGADLARAVVGEARKARTYARARLHRARLLPSSVTSGILGDGSFLEMGVYHSLQAPLVLARRIAFTASQLSYATFRRGRLRRARFVRCEMERVDFRGCYLVRAEFINCYLRGARFDRSKMRGCRFDRDCDLTDASFDGPDLDREPSAGSAAALEIGA